MFLPMCRIMEMHMFFLLWIFVMPYFTDTTTAKGTVQNFTNSFNYADTLTIHYKHWLLITEHVIFLSGQVFTYALLLNNFSKVFWTKLWF